MGHNKAYNKLGSIPKFLFFSENPEKKNPWPSGFRITDFPHGPNLSGASGNASVDVPLNQGRADNSQPTTIVTWTMSHPGWWKFRRSILKWLNKKYSWSTTGYLVLHPLWKITQPKTRCFFSSLLKCDQTLPSHDSMATTIVIGQCLNTGKPVHVRLIAASLHEN